MTLKQFVAYILATPCEKCPITIFCSVYRSNYCHATAHKYYLTHGGYPNGKEKTKS